MPNSDSVRRTAKLARAERGVVLEAWLAELPERERESLRVRLEQDLTESEIADRFGISQMHVSRLLRRAIEYLQHRAEDEEFSARVT